MYPEKFVPNNMHGIPNSYFKLMKTKNVKVILMNFN